MISPEIFLLGADAFQEYIKKTSFLDDSKRKRYYKKISEWYLKANEEKKAYESLQKSNDIEE